MDWSCPRCGRALGAGATCPDCQVPALALGHDRAVARDDPHLFGTGGPARTLASGSLRLLALLLLVAGAVNTLWFLAQDIVAGAPGAFLFGGALLGMLDWLFRAAVLAGLARLIEVAWAARRGPGPEGRA